MHISELNNAISTLGGIGPAKAACFARLNIFTIADVLQFYPRAYEDRTGRTSIAQAAAQNGKKVHTAALIAGHEWFGYGRMKTLKLIVYDGTGTAELVAFNRPFLEKSYPPGTIAAVTGSFEHKFGAYQSTRFDITKIPNPDNKQLDFFADKPLPDSGVIPIYHLTEGLTGKIIQKTVCTALRQYSLGLENDIPDNIIEKYGLLSKKDALKYIHAPETMSQAETARKTLVFEELFLFQKMLAQRCIAHKGSLPRIELNSAENKANRPALSEQEFAATLSTKQKQLLARLPYKLTPDQMNVIALMNGDIDKNYGFNPATKSAFSEQAQDTLKPFSMQTLLQGDVGSGKTLVSFFVALRVIDYGSQAALIAPTELLSRQHAENAAALLEPLGVHVAYLTGNIQTKSRNVLLSMLKNGTVDFVIGTHALFSKNVQYHDLALAIIDEQHRFGVMQRSAILDKGRTCVVSTEKFAHRPFREPNLLMMSATPIPQTLARTVFGDLDVLSIKTLPQGRKPIKTHLVRAGNERNAYEAVRTELRAMHQAYFVYPAIERNFDSADSYFDSSEKNQKATGTALKSAEEMYTFLQKTVYPEYKCALIHSKIDEETQNAILSDFKEHKIDILVATTVVEVGVDVPNATCMVIEQADRFGLAALHQLRGRVGRGDAQSFCFLIYRNEITENGIQRMKVLHETTDGFTIAEEDLKLRGPGEITGTLQSGELTFRIADPYRDEQIMQSAREEAFRVVSEQERNAQ